MLRFIRSNPRSGIRCLLLVVCVGTAAPARAQIYTWKDASGNLVLSNKKPGATPSAAPSFTVPKAQGVRTTRAAVTERARAFDDLISEHSRSQGVRADLVRAVMQVESGFNPSALSPKGAMGLMQLMPATARQYGVRNAFNPAENVRGGVAYLRELLTRYQENEELALAAYNAGPGAVDKHGQTVPPYRETRSYVARINGMAARPITMRDKTIYKITETTADGRSIVRYTDKKPTGSFDVVGHP